MLQHTKIDFTKMIMISFSLFLCFLFKTATFDGNSKLAFGNVEHGSSVHVVEKAREDVDQTTSWQVGNSAVGTKDSAQDNIGIIQYSKIFLDSVQKRYFINESLLTVIDNFQFFLCAHASRRNNSCNNYEMVGLISQKLTMLLIYLFD